MVNISTIIWDWNGTLLNDRQLSIEAINLLLKKRKLPEINQEKYLEAFGFPVRDYYERIGFDFSTEPFEIPAIEFIDAYYANIDKAKLHAASLKALDFFTQKGFQQLILSASEQNKLSEVLSKYQIEHFFESVCGLNHHYGTSKAEIGKAMLERRNIKAENACLIGDTTHDHEVAKELGCRCILIADGHQAAKKLKETGSIVIDNIEQLIENFAAIKTCKPL